MKTPKHITDKFLPLHQSANIAKMGFDEECFGYYENQDESLVIFYSNISLNEEQSKKDSLRSLEIRNSTLPQWVTAAPLIEDANDWFLEKFGLYPDVFVEDDSNFGYVVSRLPLKYNEGSRKEFPVRRGFKNKRDAKIAAFEEMVRIVVEKRNNENFERPVTKMMENLNLINSDRSLESFNQHEQLVKMFSEKANMKSNERISKKKLD